MTFLERHLEPFVEERQRSGWRGLVWLLLLVLAPVAYVAAIVLGSRLPTAGVRYLKPAEMMARAERVAAERGVEVSGMRRVMVAGFDKNVGQYLDDARYIRLPAEQKRFAGYANAKVTFYGGGKWVEVRLRPDGSLTGLRLSDTWVPAPRTITEEEARQLASDELARVLAPPASFGLGQAEMLPGDAPETRRFQWQADFAGLPEFRGLFVVDVRGDRVTAVREEFSIDPAVVAARTPRWWTVFNGLRILVLMLFACYGIYRFARRSMEKEVAYARCAVLFAGAMALTAGMYALHSGLYLQGLTAERLVGSFVALTIIASLVSASVNAILLTLCYGGAEGELREIYPGKLTSLDALLTGRWYAANVGRAVVVGIAVAGWALLVQMTGQHLFPSALPRALGTQVMITYTEHGWLTLLLNEPYMAMFVCMFGLSLPLMFANRNVTARRWRVAAIVMLSLAGVSFSANFEAPLPWDLLRVLITGLLVLVSFWRGDFLAAVVAVVLYVTGQSVSLLAPLGGDWPGVVRYVVVFAVFTGVVALVAAYRGRDLSEEEVRPKYAERLLERLGLQAEVSAARDAQLRLLPAELPTVPGLKLAASCTPAQEVGGDFYDFFPLRNGGLGVLVAEGGSTGLASALSIGLAKGFLLYAADKHWAPGEALRRLRPVLLRAVKGNIEKLGLAYAAIDGEGQVRVARFGAYPKLVELAPGMAPRDVELLGVAEADYVVERTLRLGEQSTLLLATDGLMARIRERSGLSLSDWLAQRKVTGVEALHGALLSEVGSGFDDDITVVMVERQAPALGLREGVA